MAKLRDALLLLRDVAPVVLMLLALIALGTLILVADTGPHLAGWWN